MPRYAYYVVESSFVVRVGRHRAERLLPGGRWVPCDDMWDVSTNGRWVKGGEAEALAAAAAIFDRDRRDGEERRAVEAFATRPPDSGVNAFFAPPVAGELPGAVVSGVVPRGSVTARPPPLPGGARCLETRWSPDGGRVAAVIAGGGRAEVFICDLAGGGWTGPLKPPGERLGRLSWSPDGERLAWVDPRLSSIQSAVLWTDVSGPRAEASTTPGVACAFPPDGRALLVADACASTIELVDVKTGAARGLALYHSYHPEGFRPHVVLSPDGRRFVFTTRDMAGDAGWVMGFDFETETPRVVARVPSARADIVPFWSPGGDRVGLRLFDRANGRTGIVLVDPTGAEGGRLVYRSDVIDPPGIPAFSPDGASLLLFRLDPAGADPPGLRLIERATGLLRRVDVPGLAPGDLRFLSDGRLAVDGGADAALVELSNPSAAV